MFNVHNLFREKVQDLGIREFSKRMDTDVPFYYNLDISHLMKDQIMMRTKMIITVNPLRLHKLGLNQREDSFIFLFGRTYLPARHHQTILQLFH